MLTEMYLSGLRNSRCMFTPELASAMYHGIGRRCSFRSRQKVKVGTGNGGSEHWLTGIILISSVTITVKKINEHIL